MYVGSLLFLARIINELNTMTLNELFRRIGGGQLLLYAHSGSWRISQPKRRAGDNHQPAVPFAADSMAQRMGEETTHLAVVLLHLEL